jgi:hypothetical protein
MGKVLRFVLSAAVLVCGCSLARGEEFPVMSWELPPRTAEFSDARHGLVSLAECGFTVAGFVRPEHLAECERLGLRAIVCPAEGILSWEKMTDAQIDETIERLVSESRQAKGSAAVMGYFITDEPGIRQFANLTKAAAAVQKHAPGKLAYVNLFPDYATLGAPDLSQLGTASYTEYLEQFVREVKPALISYDNYRVQYSQDLKNANVAASYFENLLEIRRVSMEHELPFWNIVSSNQIRPDMPPPSPANLLMQAYTTLAAGAKGLTWYTYYSGGYDYAPIDKEGNRTASWSYLKMVNDQVKVVGKRMMKLKSMGVYFVGDVPGKGLTRLPGKLVQAVECAMPVMVGEFAGEGGETWVMVVNLNLRESAEVKVRWQPTVDGQAVRMVSVVDGSMMSVKENALRLAAGQGMLVRVSD